MSLSANFGIINGSIGEYVFDTRCSNTDNMLSRLDWDVITVPYFEGDLTFNIIKYLYININGLIGIPVYSGVMQDYDWLNSCDTDHPEWQKDDPTELTNYSKHSNQVDDFYNISFKLGGNIPISSKFTLTPYIGYKYDYIGMSAYDGYGLYKWNNFIPWLFSGKTISYIQEINALLLGFNIDSNLIPRVPIQAYFQLFPIIGTLSALDLHHSRNLAFLDKYNSILVLEGKISAYFEINKYNRIGLSSFIQYMPLQKGQTGNGGIGPNGELPSNFFGTKEAMGGASRFLYSFSLGYQFKL